MEAVLEHAQCPSPGSRNALPSRTLAGPVRHASNPILWLCETRAGVVHHPLRRVGTVVQRDELIDCCQDHSKRRNVVVKAVHRPTPVFVYTQIGQREETVVHAVGGEESTDGGDTLSRRGERPK
jgi:hypothetical protein